MFNADDGTNMSGWKYWKKFKEEWTVNIIPVDEAGDYSQFYAHLDIEASDGMAWGITGQKEIVLFVIDSQNPFTMMSNAMPIAHELLHAIYQDKVGTSHITRLYDAPEGKKGTKGPASTVIVHDVYYGSKTRLKFWIGWTIGWIPIYIPFLQVKTARKLYDL